MDYRGTFNVVNANLETGIGLGADGNDQFRNIEHLNGSEVAGTDTLIGNAGANAIDGRAGDDSIVGGGGDDSLRGGPGNDTLVGGTQTFFDFADFGGSTGPIVANLATGVATGDGTDTLFELEGVIGSPGNDSITGNRRHLNWFWLVTGNDTVDGRGGDDYIAYDNGRTWRALTPARLHREPRRSAPATGGCGTDMFTGIERACGRQRWRQPSPAAAGACEVSRPIAAGRATTRSTAAAASIGPTTSAPTSALTMTLANSGDTTFAATGGTDSLRSIENISASNSFGDALTGNDAANWLRMVPAATTP